MAQSSLDEKKNYSESSEFGAIDSQLYPEAPIIQRFAQCVDYTVTALAKKNSHWKLIDTISTVPERCKGFIQKNLFEVAGSRFPWNWQYLKQPSLNRNAF